MRSAPSSSSHKQRLSARLAAWGRVGARLSLLSSLLGIAQYALFTGFAFCAATALAALVAGDPFLPWLAGAAGFAILRAGAQAGEIRAGVEASARIRRQVRLDAAQALARRGPAFTERVETGETASALIDAVEKLDGYFGRYKPLMLVVAGGPLVILLAAGTASWVVAGIFLVTAPLLIVFMALVGAGAAAASKDQLATLRRLAGRFNDRLQALETLNAFNAAGREADGLRTSANDFRQRTMRVLRLAFLSSAILEFFAALAVAATAICVGFSLLGEMPFSTGEIITLQTGAFVLILAPEFYLPLRRLSAAYHDRADAEAAAEALMPLFEDEDAAPTAAPPVLTTAPQLQFLDVSCRYRDGRLGLAPLSFTAGAGSVTALWGPSGVGKSTALKLLMGYAPLSDGRIEIDGKALCAPLIGQAAWIAQRPRLFHGTLRDNIRLFDTTICDAAILQAAEAAGVMDFAASLPAGLETEIGDRGYGLSGGQAQRVSLARALAVDMKLLLLDEPTAHLDGEAEARFLEALRRAAQGRTVLIATHSAAVRAVCDQLIELQPAVEDAA